MTWKTLELCDYDDVVRMLYLLLRKTRNVDLDNDIYAIIDKLEESK